jgi:hypothetical protein
MSGLRWSAARHFTFGRLAARLSGWLSAALHRAPRERIYSAVGWSVDVRTRCQGRGRQPDQVPGRAVEDRWDLTSEVLVLRSEARRWRQWRSSASGYEERDFHHRQPSAIDQRQIGHRHPVLATRRTRRRDTQPEPMRRPQNQRHPITNPPTSRAARALTSRDESVDILTTIHNPGLQEPTSVRRSDRLPMRPLSSEHQSDLADRARVELTRVSTPAGRGGVIEFADQVVATARRRSRPSI